MGGRKCLKNLKRGRAEKRGGDTKILKGGQGVGLSASKSPHFYGMLCAAFKQHQLTMIRTLIGSNEQ